MKNSIVSEIPKGYSWCNECNGLTPRKNMGQKSKFGECIICGSYHMNWGYCDNCGYDNDELVGSLQETVVIHHDGCHCQYDDDDPFFTHAEYIVLSFKKQWMSPAPDRMSYLLPRDNDWYYKHHVLDEQWKEAYNIKCGCPQYIVYKNINIFNYKQKSVFSQDCSNAIEWSYDIRCSNCGFVYHIEDSNC